MKNRRFISQNENVLVCSSPPCATIETKDVMETMKGRKTKGGPTDTDRHVAGRMKQCRLLRGHSQEKMSKALGITFQQIQKYEKGHNRISAGRLWDIACFLEVTPGYFYEELDATSKDKPADLDKDAAECLRFFNGLPPSGKRGLIRFFRAVQEEEQEKQLTTRIKKERDT